MHDLRRTCDSNLQRSFADVSITDSFLSLVQMVTQTTISNIARSEIAACHEVTKSFQITLLIRSYSHKCLQNFQCVRTSHLQIIWAFCIVLWFSKSDREHLHVCRLKCIPFHYGWLWIHFWMYGKIIMHLLVLLPVIFKFSTSCSVYAHIFTQESGH